LSKYPNIRDISDAQVSKTAVYLDTYSQTRFEYENSDLESYSRKQPLGNGRVFVITLTVLAKFDFTTNLQKDEFEVTG
jgi:hypothetical protein